MSVVPLCGRLEGWTVLRHVRVGRSEVRYSSKTTGACCCWWRRRRGVNRWTGDRSSRTDAGVVSQATTWTRESLSAATVRWTTTTEPACSVARDTAAWRTLKVIVRSSFKVTLKTRTTTTTTVGRTRLAASQSMIGRSVYRDVTSQEFCRCAHIEKTTHSYQTWKRALHVYSPGVAAERHVRAL